MLPLTTTTITILRPTAADMDAEPYQGNDAEDRYVVQTGVKANIGGSLQGNVVGREWVAGGEQSLAKFGLRTDPCDITHLDWIRDEKTGEVYKVLWVVHRQGLGLDYMQGQVTLDEGLV